MILINFSHPLTPAQVAQIEALAGRAIERLIQRPVQFDEQQPFAPQVQTLVDGVALTPEEWQTLPLLVVLPSLNFIAAALLAELHGRMGYFPPVVRTRPAAGQTPRVYEVAEILDLQQIREEARKRR
ncbi:MAG TPA: CRISPR-associated protein Csx15 [Caldilineaceae bacterium]|nr:CRISPR-associated protein Csx15 [Caldilineaceae bacterium]